MMAVPLSLLNTPGSPINLKPTHHMYYGHRLIDVNDDLPKFLKSKGEPWTPRVTKLEVRGKEKLVPAFFSRNAIVECKHTVHFHHHIEIFKAKSPSRKFLSGFKKLRPRFACESRAERHCLPPPTCLCANPNETFRL